MKERFEFWIMIAALVGIGITVIRFWSIPERLDKLESKVENMDLRLARIEGHLFGAAPLPAPVD